MIQILSALALLLLCPFSYAVETAFEKDTSLPLVYLNFAIRAGAVTDPINQSGITNFMGEMLLRGTRSRTKQQIDLALDQMGAKLGVETRAEALIIRGAVLSSQIEPFLNLLEEITTQPSFPEIEIKKTKSEMISFIQEQLGHDQSLAAHKFNGFLFQEHPYGKPLIGKTKDIENLTQAQILKHYNMLFQDPLILVAGAGDVSSGTIRSWADQIGKIRGVSQEGLPQKVGIPQNGAHRRLLIVDKPDRTQTQIHIGQIGPKMTDSDFFPLYLGNHAFGGASFSAVLMTEIRVKRGWSYGASSHFRFGLQPRSWDNHLFPAAKDTAAALKLTLSLLKNLKENGITNEQFEFAQKSLVNSSGFMYNTPKKRVENKLLEKTLDLPDGYIRSYGTKIQKVTLSNVNTALKKYVQPDRLAITVLATSKDLKVSLVQAAEVKEDQVKVIPYTSE